MLIKYIYKMLYFLLLFFVYNIESIDSNSDKILLYDTVNIHDENTFSIYFKDIVNSYDLDSKLKNYNIEVLSYIIDDKKYYARNTIDLINKYVLDKNMEEKIYYKLNGIVIEGINVKCENIEIIKLSSVEKIY